MKNKHLLLLAITLMSILLFSGCATTGSRGGGKTVKLEPGAVEVNTIPVTSPVSLTLVVDPEIKNEMEFEVSSVPMVLVDYRNSIIDALVEGFTPNFTSVSASSKASNKGVEIVVSRATIQPTMAIKYHAILQENGTFIKDISDTTEARTVQMSSTIWTYQEDMRKITKQLVEEAILKMADGMYDGFMRDEDLLQQEYWQTRGGETESSGGSGAAPVAIVRPETLVLDQLSALENDGVRALGWAVDTAGEGGTYIQSMPYNVLDVESEDTFTIGFVQYWESGKENPSIVFADPEAINMYYGAAVALSPDERLVVIGAPGLTPDAESYLYAYLKPKGGWNSSDEYPATLFGVPGEKGTNTGISVDISGETGKTILFGAPGEDGHGRARYFIKPPDGWDTLTNDNMLGGYLGVGDPQIGDEFGRSVAISKDDSTIVIGAPGRGKNRGAVYLFKRPENGWTNTRTLYALKGDDLKSGDRYGQSVAVSDDGKTVVVGAPGANNGKGKIYIFTNVTAGDQLSFDKTHMVNTSDYNSLGITIDLSANGKIMAAGSTGIDNSGFFIVFEAYTSNWSDYSEIYKLNGRPDIAEEKGSLLGYHFDLHDNGKRVLLGAPLYDNGKGITVWNDVME